MPAAPITPTSNAPFRPGDTLVAASKMAGTVGNGVKVVAEFNRYLEPAGGAPFIDADAIDFLIETEHALPELAPPALDEAARTIGRHVAELVPDGACIQTGIGSIPAAVLGALPDGRSRQ